MRVRSLGLSSGQSRAIVDVLVLLAWSFLVGPMAVLLLLPWRRLLPTERALTLLGIGLVMAVLAVAAEVWRRRGDRARRFADEITISRRVPPGVMFFVDDEVYSSAPLTEDQWRELERICR